MKNSNGVQRLNEVTPVSKVLAAVIFVILPFLGFWLGFNYQNKLTDMYAACMKPVEQMANPMVQTNKAK